MNRLATALLTTLLLTPTVGAQEIPLRYRALASTPRLRLVEVLGTPELPPYGLHSLSADGKFAFFASIGVGLTDEETNSVLTLWDVQKGRLLKEITVAKAAVSAAALFPDATRALTALVTTDAKGDQTRRLVLWDLETGKEVRTVLKSKDMILSLSVLPGGERALGRLDTGKLILWDLATGKEALQIKDQPKGVLSRVEVSPDGRRALTSTGVWDLKTGDKVRDFPGQQNGFASLAVSADGKRLAAYGQSALHVWEVDSGKILFKFKKDAPGATAISLAFAPDAERLVLAMSGFDAATGTRPESSLSMLDVTKENEVWSTHAKFTGEVPIIFVGKSEILIGGGINPWTTWSLDKGQLLSTSGGHKSAVVALAHDGAILYSLEQEGPAKIWMAGSVPKVFLGLRESATALVGGKGVILAASADRSLLVWNEGTGKARRIRTSHAEPISCLAVSADGKRAVTAGSERIMKYWDLESGKELASFTGHSENINAVALSPDGRWAASASDDNTVRLWPLDKKADDADPIVLDGHKRQVTALGFAPDGKHLVSASQDQTLKLWDVGKQRAVRTFSGHKNWIGSVLFRGPDQLVSAGDDLTVRLWDVKTGKEFDRLDLATVGDCPKCLTLHDDHLYVGTAGWVILKLRLGKN